MNATLNKFLKIFALCIVLYFLLDAISVIDTAPSKYNIEVFKKKAAVDKTGDIDEVKYIAKSYLDDLSREHDNKGSDAILNMNLLIVLICIQVYLNYGNTKEADAA